MVPISGCTYKNYIKIQVNSNNIASISTMPEISRKSVTITSIMTEDLDLKKSRSNTSPSININKKKVATADEVK